MTVMWVVSTEERDWGWRKQADVPVKLDRRAPAAKYAEWAERV
jgi:hypothetical protein